MRHMSKSLAWIGVVALLVLAAVVTWGRLRGPSETQAAALALLQRDLRPAQGRNAAPALWLANYDVPADQLDAVYVQDRQRMQAWVAALPLDGSEPSSFTSVAAKQYVRLPPITEADKALTCGTHDDDCLAKVRAHREDVRTLLSRQQLRLRHDEALSNYNQDWSEFPISVHAQIPPYMSAHNLGLTAAALDFADGKQAEALNQVCTNASTMRRLHNHSNTLIGTMVADAQLRTAANLFGHMLGELPADQTLPDSCMQAFAGVGLEDANMCASMQWEFRIYISVFEASEKMMTWWQRPLYAQSASQRLAAPIFAWTCDDVTRAKVLADHPFNDVTRAKVLADHPFNASDMPEIQPDRIDRITNPMGNMLFALGQPDFHSYLNRHQDTAAVLRLVATIMWLRQTHVDGRPLADRLAQRPAWMDLDNDRQLKVAADGRSIHMGYTVLVNGRPNGHVGDA